MKHNLSTLKKSLMRFNSKLMQRILVSSLLLFGTASIHAQSVVNSGFETGALSPWTVASTASISTTAPYAGTYCGKAGNGTLQQIVTGLTANTNYILTGMFKAAAGKATIGVKTYKATDASDAITVQTTSTVWIGTGNIAFRTGATNTSAIVYLNNSVASGYGDDFSITVSPVDAVAPTAPTIINAIDILRHGFVLSWTAANDDVAISAYEVYVNGVLFGTTTGGIKTSMQITGLTEATTYSMTVKSYDAAGNSSPLSASYDVLTSSLNDANIVENGGFENSTIFPWTVTGGSFTGISTATPLCEGLQYYYLTAGSILSQNISGLQPLTTYVLKCKFRKTTNGTRKIGVKNYTTPTSGDKKISLPYTQQSLIWATTSDLIFTTGASMTTAEIYVRDSTDNSDWPVFDAFSVVAADVTPPTVEISSSTTLTTDSNPIPVTFTFNEKVTGFTIGDLSVSNGIVGNFVAVSGTVYTADITPIIDGTITVDIAAGTSADLLGNSNIAASQFTRSYTSASTGLNKTEIKNYVYSHNSEIVIEGLIGQIAGIYSIAGQSVKSILLTSNCESIAANKGFYIVRVGAQNFKLLLK